MHESVEQELVALGKQGDTEAISKLFDQHYKNSLNTARRMLRTVPEAEDAVQAAFCSAFQSLGAFRGDSSFGTWVHRIVVNRCLMTIREPWRRTVMHSAGHEELPGEGALDDFASTGPSPEKSAWCGQLAAAHDEALRRLPEKLRGAYTMYSISGLSIAEVANALGITVGGAKTRIFRARNALRLSLENVWLGYSRTP